MKIISKIGNSFHKGIKYNDFEFLGIKGAFAIYLGVNKPFIDIIKLPF